MTQRFRLQVKLMAQEYFIWLDEGVEQQIFMFDIYTEEQTTNTSLMMTIQECCQEKYDDSDTFFNEIVTNLSETKNFNMSQDFFGENKTSETINLAIVDSVNSKPQFSLDVVLRTEQNYSFHKEFLGYTSIKVLETNIFDKQPANKL